MPCHQETVHEKEQIFLTLPARSKRPGPDFYEKNKIAPKPNLNPYAEAEFHKTMVER